MQNTAERSKAWSAVLILGCLGPLIAVLGLAIAAWMNRQRIATLYHRAAATLVELGGVERALQTRYGAIQITVQSKHDSRVAGSILSINLINPPPLDGVDLDGPDAEKKAREVAIVARSGLAKADDYDNYEVIFTRSAGVGITITKSRRFRFRANDLPPPSSPSGGSEHREGRLFPLALEAAV